MLMSSIGGLHCFYSHVNYSVTKIFSIYDLNSSGFYSHVNYSVTKIRPTIIPTAKAFTVT